MNGSSLACAPTTGVSASELDWFKSTSFTQPPNLPLSPQGCLRALLWVLPFLSASSSPLASFSSQRTWTSPVRAHSLPPSKILFIQSTNPHQSGVPQLRTAQTQSSPHCALSLWKLLLSGPLDQPGGGHSGTRRPTCRLFPVLLLGLPSKLCACCVR